MPRTFLIVAEVRHNALRQVSLEAIAAARLSAFVGDRIEAVLLGTGGAGDTDIEAEQLGTDGPGDTTIEAELFAHGAQTVYTVKHPDLDAYQPEPHLHALLQVIQTAAVDAVYLGHTALGRDLAPRLAAALGSGQISDAVAIDRDGAAIIFTRPIYAGKALERKTFTASSSAWVVTIRPNNFAIPARDGEGGGGRIVEVPYGAPALRAVIKDVVRRTSGVVDLSEAKIVVSGGRGVKSAAGFAPLAELAAVLGGAVGASRGACDAGYCDYALQIGQTGKVVTPDLYIACGISGAIQHLAGMSGSKVIVAINKDPDAPIFQIADYGIVGDLFEIVPLLTKEFQQRA